MVAFRVGELCDSELRSNLQNGGGTRKTKVPDGDGDDDGDMMSSKDVRETSRGASMQSMNAVSQTNSRRSQTHMETENDKRYEDERELYRIRSTYFQVS